MENLKELMRKKNEEPPKRCPRCDSTHTKFCYFNNYSLSQPRHFCKSCRRYWTDGGTIRNIPLGGGGIRKAKRTTRKSSSSAQLDQRSHLSAPAQDINGAGFLHSSGVPISYCFVGQSPSPARVLSPSSNAGSRAAGFGESSFEDFDLFASQQQQIPAPPQANATAPSAGQLVANWGEAAAAGGGEEEDELDRWVRELANDGSA